MEDHDTLGIVRLVKKIVARYHISTPDLADAGESNRIHLCVVSFLFIFVGVFDVIFLVVRYHSNLKARIPAIIYFGLYAVAGTAICIYAHLVKDKSREKAYIWKTIPFYLIFCIGLTAAVYNFYLLGQPFNGFITFCLTGFISICAFSFSPFMFLPALVTAMLIMAPGVYTNFGMTGLADAILVTVVMFSLSLYKRRVEKKYIMLLKKQTQNLEAKTFGNFTLMYDGSVIKFSRTKSSELIAYLLYKNGSSVKTKELITVLWGDHADSSRYGSSLRNLIVDIRHTLGNLQIQNFFIVEYNNFRINPDVIKCDWYDFLAGDKSVLKKFSGEFMSQFSWAEDAAGFLEMKVLGN